MSAIFQLVARYTAIFAERLDALFYKPLLACAIGVFSLACLTWVNSKPEDSRPFITALEAASQEQVFGLGMPQFLLLVAVVVLMLAAAVKSHSADER